MVPLAWLQAEAEEEDRRREAFLDLDAAPTVSQPTRHAGPAPASTQSLAEVMSRAMHSREDEVQSMLQQAKHAAEEQARAARAAEDARAAEEARAKADADAAAARLREKAEADAAQRRREQEVSACCVTV